MLLIDHHLHTLDTSELTPTHEAQKLILTKIALRNVPEPSRSRYLEDQGKEHRW